MARKQSSKRLSALAGKYAHVTEAEIGGLALTNLKKLVADIRSLAASVLSQDETK